MATMYETIMDLPLFKGVSKDLVSSFLEKTQLRFTNYIQGDCIVGEGQSFSSIGFIIKGEVVTEISNPEETLRIYGVYGVGRVIGADRLYGILRQSPYKVTALSEVSVMEFSKEQYVNLLYSDPIYMLNFFNYLSLRAQRPLDSLRRFAGGGLASHLAMWVNIATEPEAHSVEIEIGEATLAAMAGGRDFNLELQQLAENGIIELRDGRIVVVDRDALLEAGEIH